MSYNATGRKKEDPLPSVNAAIWKRMTSRKKLVYKITRYTKENKGVACRFEKVYRDNKTIKDCLERRLEQYGTTTR